MIQPLKFKRELNGLLLISQSYNNSTNFSFRDFSTFQYYYNFDVKACTHCIVMLCREMISQILKYYLKVKFLSMVQG